MSGQQVLHGTSFVHKTNPYDQTKSTRLLVLRKRSDDLKLNCTSKGIKARTGGKMADFIVAIDYSKSVMLCKQFERRLTGECSADFIRIHLTEAFQSNVF